MQGLWSCPALYHRIGREAVVGAARSVSDELHHYIQSSEALIESNPCPSIDKPAAYKHRSVHVKTGPPLATVRNEERLINKPDAGADNRTGAQPTRIGLRYQLCSSTAVPRRLRASSSVAESVVSGRIARRGSPKFQNARSRMGRRPVNR